MKNASPFRLTTSVKQLLYLVFSLAVTAGVFWYLFNQITLSEVLSLILNSNRFALVLFVALSLAMSLLRMWRYLLILEISGHRPAAIPLFLVVLVRNFFSDLLPARLGTLIYVYLGVSRLGLSLSAAGSSFALSFLLDILALAPMLLLAAMFSISANSISFWALLAGGFVVLTLAAASLIALGPLLRISRRFIESLWHTKNAEKTIKQIADIEGDLRQVKQAGILHTLFGISIGVRAFKYASLYMLMYALVEPLGYTLSRLSIPKVFLGICASEMAASLPISGIAGFGAYEGTWSLVFNLIGFDRIAEITSISHHLITQCYGYGIGVIAVLLLLITRAKSSPKLRQRSLSSIFILIALCAAIASPFIIRIFATKFTNNPANMNKDCHQVDMSIISSLIEGDIVYEHDDGIWYSSIGSTNETCLASNGTYPRWSPDGKSVAYVHDKSVMVVSLNGDARKICEAETPRAIAWHPTGTNIIFTNGRSIEQVDLYNHQQRVLAKGHQFREVDISNDGSWLVTTALHPTRLIAYDLSNGNMQFLSMGCSGSFSPNGRAITRNNADHLSLSILSWPEGDVINSVSAPPNQKFDNQFWSNHKDWIAAVSEGQDTAIYIHQISTDSSFRVTRYDDMDRPDLFVSIKKQ